MMDKITPEFLSSGKPILETLEYNGTTFYHFQKPARLNWGARRKMKADWWGFLTDEDARAYASNDSERALQRCKAGWDELGKEQEE